MLSDFHWPIFRRQRETLPNAINTLEAIAATREMSKTTVTRLCLTVAHDLRNQLTAVSVLVELTEAMEGQETGQGSP